jgi:hypothetical protein
VSPTLILAVRSKCQSRYDSVRAETYIGYRTDLLRRKGSVAETSDSEAGAGLMQHLARRKQSTVPTLIEP